MQSRENIIKTIEQKEIKFISLQFTDIKGQIKSLELPVNQIEKILDNKITFDGSSVSGFRENETMDLVFHPDIETFKVYPSNIAKLRNTARFICDIYNSDGTPFEGCPRGCLKRIIEKMNTEYGYTMNIGPEAEFFLFKTDNANNILNNVYNHVGYYDLNAEENTEEVLNQMVIVMEAMGLKFDAIHHEAAPLQFEVDLEYDNILKTADNLLTFKHIAKMTAGMYGFCASFMPKPLYGVNGSGLHLNISLERNGENAFYNPENVYRLSKEALFSVGSLLKNINGITAILNPTVNSYKRLVRDYEAPVYLAWSVVTRSALIRIPQKRGAATRLELRSPDFSTNPYLAFAVLLQTCIDGIRNETDPPKPIEKNLFALSSNEIKMRKIKCLPRNMFSALENFEKSMLCRAALGDYIFNEFLETKRKEWKTYRKQVTPWEIKNYMEV